MKALKCLASLLVCLLATASLVAAQGKVPNFVQVTTVTVKPGSVSEFEDYVKKLMAGANKVNAPQRVTAYQLISGGPQFTYTFGVPFDKWEEMDRWMSIPEILTKAYGDLEGNKILRAGRATFERSEIATRRTLHELSTRPRAFDPPAAFLWVNRTEVDPDMSSAYEMYPAKQKAAQEQAPNAPTTIRRVSVQGLSSFYTAARAFNKHAERDGWPGELLTKAYGEAEARHLTEMSLRAVRKREIWLLAYRPDLSRVTVTPTSDN